MVPQTIINDLIIVMSKFKSDVYHLSNFQYNDINQFYDDAKNYLNNNEFDELKIYANLKYKISIF